MKNQGEDLVVQGSNMEYIIIICSIVICVGVRYWMYNPYDRISFKDSLDLTSLPIITFVNNNRKLHFLLDTGASKSIINERELNSCIFTELEDKNVLTGLDGISRFTRNIQMSVAYSNSNFIGDFQVTDMSAVFDNIKVATGVSVHGLLGSDFFQKYKYVLDFEKLIAYSKKV